MAKVRIELDGRVLRSDEYSFESISISKTIEPKKDSTQDITFYGSAFEQIKAVMIDPQFGFAEYLPIRIYDLCCSSTGDLIFEGRIEGKSLEYCDDNCYVQTTATRLEPLLDCLKGQILSQGLEGIGHFNALVFEDRSGFEAAVIRIVQTIANVILVPIVIVLTVILSFLTIVEAVIQGIDALLDALRSVPLLRNVIPDIIPNEDRDILPDISDLGDAVASLQELIAGLNNYSYFPVPFIRTMLQNACDQCGARLSDNYEFVSSIFTDPNSEYYNAGWIKPDGDGFDQPTAPGISDNSKPLITAESLLDDLSSAFNSRWWVENGVLRIEPKAINRGLVDYSSKRACFTFPEQDVPARAEILFQRDSIDIAGNLVTSDFNYLVEFSSDGTTQRGKQDYQVPFSAPNVDFLQASGFQFNVNAIRISRGGSGFSKLVIFDNNGQLTDQAPLKGERLWDSFFEQTENPNLETYNARRFDLTSVYECGQEIPQAGSAITLKTAIGVVETVEIDYTNRQITLSGKA